jgi:hypothetical protein
MEERTENPVAAIGRKIKSVLGTDQRPSVRILRTRDSHSASRVSQSITEKPLPALPPQADAERDTLRGGMFANVRRSAGELFSRKQDAPLNGAEENEYDPDTVDLLDVVGM